MINIPKGTKDMLPEESYKWHFIEEAITDLAEGFNLKEIRTPVFESTELFARGVGETSDVVTKEMYTFEDKGGRSITLKPEGTAGAARMFIENGYASQPLPLKVYYKTPCYRYERPQAGRLREFHQFGVEYFGAAAPEADAELIFAASSFLDRLDITDARLKINSVGCKKCRGDYNVALKEYFKPHLNEMCADCRNRFEKNPMRILDCKEEACKKIVAGAPKITDYLCEECSDHFAKVRSLLDTLGLEYTVDPDIVRGLDYYTKTVFEFVTDVIGAQGTICGGGRYDNLIEELGGGSVPALGFAVGIERLLITMEKAGVDFGDSFSCSVYFASADEVGRRKAFEISSGCRHGGFVAECDLMNRSLKAQLKYASKRGFMYCVVLGEDECNRGVAKVRRMEGHAEEKEVPMENILKHIKEDSIYFLHKMFREKFPDGEAVLDIKDLTKELPENLPEELREAILKNLNNDKK